MKWPIAVVDYGIGGLGLVKLIKAKYPDLPLLYFSDAGEVPYGKLPRKVLRCRMEKVLDDLFQQGAGQVIVACHAASSVIKLTDSNVTGIKQLTLQAVLKHHGLKEIGIIGGGRTVRSGYYRKELSKHGMVVKQRVAQELSILIERGEVDSETTRQVVRQILKPLKGVGGLLLACTHYPVLAKVIAAEMGDGVKVIDPIQHVFDTMENTFEQVGVKGQDRYLTTGDPGLMKYAAQKAFQWDVEVVERCIFNNK